MRELQVILLVNPPAIPSLPKGMFAVRLVCSHGQGVAVYS